MALNDGAADDDLVEQARGGDTEAFGELVRRHQRKMFRIALEYLRDPAEAENVVQESFINAYQRIGAFKGESSFETWLTRITINRSLDWLKSKEWRIVKNLWHPAETDSEEKNSFWANFKSTAPSPEQEALGREAAALVESALGKLSPQQRLVFVLRHYEELSLQEIAEVTGVDIGTVKTHLFRAVHRVREIVRKSHERK